mgnify:FL=1
MSGWEGVFLAVLSLGSCYASYCMGQRDMFKRMRDLNEKRSRWAEWEDFDD